MTARRPLRLLSIAGSDPSGGAGLQADLKTFAAHRVYGMAVVTAITAQSTTGVLAVEPVAPDSVERQLRAVLDDIGVDAVKIGMLATAETVTRVARSLDGLAPEVPIVLDPVLRASDGTPLIEPGGLERMARELVPRVAVLTPNRAEAGALLGRTVTSEREVAEAARELAARGPAVLVTGGDAGGDEVVDVLVDRQGSATVFRASRLRSRSTHGTGCTLSAALAARLASGAELAAAVGEAIDYVRRAMDPGLDLGRGRAPLDHGAGGG
ncbi:MAG TPA: bifunctional hydroxymethylpyrimidine kinase/phosphomethylpyrimidine kinase [Thermoanaerobaculia bacterium]|nr:bifunctional hydroxymethylpyrimidine kinase/phosphomethylpyrimidine kinase [Thermoanaerobaculia bacterium]